MLQLKNVTKQYGKVVALENVNLTIRPEEFVCIIGPTGAGKSTLLHVLIGAEKADQGEVTIDGVDLTKLDHHELANYRQKIGILFQDHKLLPKKTVFENVALPLEMTKNHDAYIHARVLEVLYLVGMKDKETCFPHELSGGEKQKVALARAMVAHPSLLIADEPTGNLDPVSTDEMLKLFLKINKNGTTVIMVTHNEGIVDSLGKRVIAMKNSQIVSDEMAGKYKR
jgi:cell division transport system ATP-binding protein